MLKFTVLGLCIMLVAIIAITYYNNEEGFYAVEVNWCMNNCKVENDKCTAKVPGTDCSNCKVLLNNSGGKCVSKNSVESTIASLTTSIDSLITKATEANTKSLEIKTYMTSYLSLVSAPSAKLTTLSTAVTDSSTAVTAVLTASQTAKTKLTNLTTLLSTASSTTTAVIDAVNGVKTDVDNIVTLASTAETKSTAASTAAVDYNTSERTNGSPIIVTNTAAATTAVTATKTAATAAAVLAAKASTDATATGAADATSATAALSSSTLRNGDTVTCTKGAIAGKKYRYEDNKLRLYPTDEIAESWDHHFMNPIIVSDCSTMTFGSNMERNVSGSGATPRRNDVRPQVTLSDTGYTAMELKQKSDFLKDIQKIVKNELLADRATQHVIGMGPMGQNGMGPMGQNGMGPMGQNGMGHTASTMQGQEYGRHSQKSDDQMPSSQQNCADMSDYIKKDSIPCWGCSLDY